MSENRMTPPRPPLDDAEAGIARLLRLTGPRPGVPAERAARVREAVRAHWHAEVAPRVRARRIGRLIALAVAAALVVATGLTTWRRLSAPDRHPFAGQVEVASASLVQGAVVRVGDRLRTDAADRLAFRLTGGHSVRLDVSTVVSVDGASTLTLVAGALYVDSGGTDGTHAVARLLGVRTAAGTIHDVGTQFEVRLVDDAVRVRVREGSVSIEQTSGRVEVPAGEGLTLDAVGVRDRETALTPDAWDWIAGATPMMAIEGRTLREFLDWQTRERGLTLRFASGAIEDLAARTRLSGSVDRMTLDQALDSVLLTSGLRHRIEAGGLVVEPRL